ncbi:SDR family NAD(P)-dependent oxidoreductase [Paenibacillus sp. KQZ6P-2]|uniref:SDR family NAD(P)-dependent oxidoreductase n=1 Tax=Paenibacillus mangrovi TaxID=2931978 RepID=A0A9X2B453_9BACL|nr:SDR family NAD(P)-dependent oxidoreductase [Paenibacillus mangrovi]MCJ8014131.1 SDR family NAD(P)-dependent oxidoreductase [Paenibacillus mangrovi]
MKLIEEQVILITGATDGIGKQTAIDLARKGASILVHGRSSEKCDAVMHEIINLTGNPKISCFAADLSSLLEVKQLAEGIKATHRQLDVLINNAGVGGGDLKETIRDVSKDGYEYRLAVNYLAPFLLTYELLPLLTKESSRTINVASKGQSFVDLTNLMLEQNYSRLQAYTRSKLAMIAWTIELAERYGSRQVTFNAIHPGTQLNTKIVHQSGFSPLGEVQVGADAILHLALSADLEGVNGQYFNEIQPSQAHEQVYDGIFRKNLWETTETLIREKVYM